MTNKRKIFSTVISILFLTNIRGQYGQFEISIRLTDKVESKIINDSLLSSIQKGSAITFDTLNFYIPMTIQGRMNRINNLSLHKKQLVGLNIAIQWDTHKNQAIILGYAPIYSHTTKYPFYVAGSFNKIFSKKHDELIKQKIRESLLQSASTFTLKPTDSTSIRIIPVDRFDCIYHVEFNYLPKLLFNMFATHQLQFYGDPNLWEWFERTDDTPAQFENAKSIVLSELWSDTTIFHTTPQQNPLYYDTYYLRKKIKLIGLVLSNGKTVWTNYDAFKHILVNSKNETMPVKAQIYELYFQSDFCRHLKMDMYIK